MIRSHTSAPNLDHEAAMLLVADSGRGARTRVVVGPTAIEVDVDEAARIRVARIVGDLVGRAQFHNALASTQIADAAGTRG